MCRKRQAGVASIELAIAAPLLLLLTLATAELGRAFYEYTTLTKAVRNGARYLAANAIPDGTGLIKISAAVAAEARNLVVYGNTAGSGTPLLKDFTVADVVAEKADDHHVRVTGSYTYHPIFSTIPTFGLSNSDLVAAFDFTSTMILRGL